MLDHCIPFWAWCIVGADAVWLSRQTGALPTADVGPEDAQDLDVCMLRCEVALYVTHDDAAAGIRQVCGYPIQCGQLAAFDTQGRLVCQKHRGDA